MAHGPASGRHTYSDAPWIGSHVAMIGEFLSEERWIAKRHPYAGRFDDFGMSTTNAPELGSAHSPEADDFLHLLIGVIADEVHRFASAASEGILLEFAARAAHARKCLPPSQRAAALRGLAEARKAALALIRKNAELEIASRRNAVILAHLAHSHRPARTLAGPTDGPNAA